MESEQQGGLFVAPFPSVQQKLIILEFFEVRYVSQLQSRACSLWTPSACLGSTVSYRVSYCSITFLTADALRRGRDDLTCNIDQNIAAESSSWGTAGPFSPEDAGPSAESVPSKYSFECFLIVPRPLAEN